MCIVVCIRVLILVRIGLGLGVVTDARRLDVHNDGLAGERLGLGRSLGIALGLAIASYLNHFRWHEQMGRSDSYIALGHIEGHKASELQLHT